MVLKPRNVVLILIATGLAGLFVRLGVWQLSRHAERAAINRAIASRAMEPELDWTGGKVIPSDTSGVVWRRVRVEGTYDRTREVVLRGRSFEGRPGVEVLTPLLVPEGALMVLRGWLPAADALRPELRTGWPSDWTDTRSVIAWGRLVPSAGGRAGQPLSIESEGREHLVLAGADLEIIAGRLPYPVLPHVVRLDSESREAAALVQPPEMGPGSGNHLPYAIQWFSFAAISVVGTAVLLRKDAQA